jgi:hypothetical protein
MDQSGMEDRMSGVTPIFMNSKEARGGETRVTDRWTWTVARGMLMNHLDIQGNKWLRTVASCQKSILSKGAIAGARERESRFWSRSIDVQALLSIQFLYLFSHS